MSIIFENVSKQYTKDTFALKNINLKINKGEFVYIVGPSGSGKSSLIKTLYRDEPITSGKLTVLGEDVSNIKHNKVHFLRQRMGVIFQDYNLLPNKTVFENISYTLDVTNQDYTTFNDRVLEALEFVGLLKKAYVFPNELSGGEQQRVAIARAIVNQPEIIIADEPTGNLDPEISWGIMNLLERINLNGTTVLMVTHNDNIVNTLLHRTITIKDGEIVEDKKDSEALA